MSAEAQSTGGDVGMQFSVYPLRQEHLSPAVKAAAKAAAGEGLMVRVGELSTFAHGDEETVFKAARAAFVAAQTLGPTVMIVTLSSRVPERDAVAGVQAAADG